MKSDSKKIALDHTQWIPIENPPKEYKHYLVLDVYGKVRTDLWRQPLGGTWLGCAIVTHWMPIPTLPEDLDKTLWGNEEYRLDV